MNNEKKYSTDFLFSTPTIISGIASVNIMGNFYCFNSSETGLEADLVALKNDFGVIGGDIKNALSESKKVGTK